MGVHTNYTKSSHLATKDYVASLSLSSGGVVTGGIDMSSNAITNVTTPVNSTDAATKGYVDSSGLLSILSAATATYVDAFINENAECFYAVDRGHEVVLEKNSRKIKELIDHTLSGSDASQSQSGERPTLSTQKNAKRFFIEFDGVDDKLISDINLNPQGGAADIVNIFILFRLHSFNGTHSLFRNGLFGHDNQGWDQFVCFKPTGSLIIAGVDGKDYEEIANYPPLADLSALNTWHCLSIHWDVPGGANASSAWVNGQKIHDFTASTSPGANTMVFGDIDVSTVLPLHGDVQMFVLFKGQTLSVNVIKAHHKMICERFGINHKDIVFS